MKRELRFKNLELKKSQEGMVLLWTLLVLAVLLVIAFTMTNLVVKELRISANIDESNRAYSAADAGMEWVLYQIKKNNSCPANRNHYSLDSTLVYSTSCTDLNGKVTIESTGVSNDTTSRKLKTTISSASSQSINTFDTDPGLSGGYYAFSNSDSNIAGNSLIIQQFDLTNLNKDTVGSGFTVGMADGVLGSPGSTDFGVIFTKAGTDVNVSLDGNINSGAISSNNFKFTPSSVNANGNPITYRVKLEYSRYGSGGLGYTVVRAIVLQRDISTGQEEFNCIGDNKSYIVYSGLSFLGVNPTLVKVEGGSYDSGQQNINIGSGAKLDNMVFWGKQ